MEWAQQKKNDSMEMGRKMNEGKKKTPVNSHQIIHFTSNLNYRNVNLNHFRLLHTFIDNEQEFVV